MHKLGNNLGDDRCGDHMVATMQDEVAIGRPYRSGRRTVGAKQKGRRKGRRQHLATAIAEAGLERRRH